MLVDIVVRGLEQETEAEGLAEKTQILDRIADDVGPESEHQREGDDLQDDGAGVLVVPQPREGVAGRPARAPPPGASSISQAHQRCRHSAKPGSKPGTALISVSNSAPLNGMAVNRSGHPATTGH